VNRTDRKYALVALLLAAFIALLLSISLPTCHSSPAPAFAMAENISPVPEPGTYGLFGVGLLVLAIWRRRK
jgi:hypothetical protein